MSSSSKYPSGLSNWAGSDKPTRADFVEDNRILDENALWRAQYDADGTVAAAGGIAGYAMTPTDYDPEAQVKAAGGIPGYFANALADGDVMLKANYAPEATAAMEEGQLVITSVYARPGNAYEVRFIVPQGFESTTAAVIDGQPVSICNMMGEGMALEATPGVPVSLTRVENRAFPKVGGAPVKTFVNYDVVGGTTQPDGQENRFWVNTSQGIPGYFLSNALNLAPYPLELAVGTVCVITNGTQYPFAAYRGNMGAVLRPLSAYQWSGSAWVQRQLSFYYNSAWRTFNVSLYSFGVENPIIGSWTGFGGDLRKGEQQLGVAFNQGGAAGWTTALPIDVTGYNTFRYQFWGRGFGADHNFGWYMGLSRVRNSSNSGDWAMSVGGSWGGSTADGSANIANLSGNLYPFFYGFNNWNTPMDGYMTLCELYV